MGSVLTEQRRPNDLSCNPTCREDHSTPFTAVQGTAAILLSGEFIYLRLSVLCRNLGCFLCRSLVVKNAV